MFTDPTTAGEKVDFNVQTSPHVGKLVLIEPKSIQYGVETTQGTADALVADVTIFEQTGPEEILNTWVFASGIKGKCEQSINEKVLGRINQTTSAKGRPYLELVAATEQDKAFASQYVTTRDQQRQASQFAQPQAPQQQPAQVPQQQVPQQASQQQVYNGPPAQQQPQYQQPAPQQAPPQQPYQAPQQPASQQSQPPF